MNVIKFLVLLFSTASGYFFSEHMFRDASRGYVYLGTLGGFILGMATLGLRDILARFPIKYFFGGFVGFAVCISPLYLTTYLNNPAWSLEVLGRTFEIKLILGVLLGYVGISVGIEKSKTISFTFLKDEKAEKNIPVPKVIDSSALIDGRIAEIIESGFLEGPFIVPRFVIKELQTLADSTDSIKRSKGRRGLDLIADIQKMNTGIEISEVDFTRIKEVDLKLVSLAKKLGGKIITMDYNLSKVAELQGIQNLNLNALSNALKPSLVAGEVVLVYVLKEGKEPGQGVAYLDDGTMVVVEEGRKFINQKVEVEVKSVLQTASGRIIFTTIRS